MQTQFKIADCPGYLEAVKRENDIRDAAMLNLTVQICGKPVRQMTLRHWIILDALDTPFQYGRAPRPEDIVAFLWILNPHFKPGNSFRKWWFVRSCRKLQYGPSAAACQKFWDETFQDRPPIISGGIKSKTPGFKSPQVSFAASVVFSVCDSVRVDKNTVIEMPLKESFQYMKLARMKAAIERGENHAEMNPSESILRRWVREKRALERAKEEQTRHE